MPPRERVRTCLSVTEYPTSARRFRLADRNAFGAGSARHLRLLSRSAARHLILTARGHAGEHDLCILQTVLTHQCVKDAGILRRYAHTAMRNGFPETLHLVAAMDSMAISHEKDRVRHGSVVPLFAIPNLIHGRGSVTQRSKLMLSSPPPMNALKHQA